MSQPRIPREAQHRPAGHRRAGRGDTVLLLGNYRPSLTLIRTMAAEGRRFIVGLNAGEIGYEYSRHVTEAWRHPAIDRNAGADFLTALASLLDKRDDIGTVLPVSDAMVLFLARHRDAIAPCVAVASPAPEIVLLCADKIKSLELAHANGVSTLPFAVVRDGRTLRETADLIGYPLTLRSLTPGLRLHDRKALIIDDAAALKTTLARWPDGHDSLLVQRFAAGGRRNMFFAARHGRLLAHVESRILRTRTVDGTGFSVLEETVEPTPALVEDTRRLIAALNYTGVGFTQFILAPDGDGHCFIEIDARLSANTAVPELSGVPMARLAIALAREDDPGFKEDDFSYGKGRLYAWTFGDLSGLKHAVRGGDVAMYGALARLVDIARAAWRADVHFTWSWRDPLPTAAIFLRGIFRLTLPVWWHRDAERARSPRAK